MDPSKAEDKAILEEPQEIQTYETVPFRFGRETVWGELKPSDLCGPLEVIREGSSSPEREISPPSAPTFPNSDSPVGGGSSSSCKTEHDPFNEAGPMGQSNASTWSSFKDKGLESTQGTPFPTESRAKLPLRPIESLDETLEESPHASQIIDAERRSEIDTHSTSQIDRSENIRAAKTNMTAGSGMSHAILFDRIMELACRVDVLQEEVYRIIKNGSVRGSVKGDDE